MRKNAIVRMMAYWHEVANARDWWRPDYTPNGPRRQNVHDWFVIPFVHVHVRVRVRDHLFGVVGIVERQFRCVLAYYGPGLLWPRSRLRLLHRRLLKRNLWLTKIQTLQPILQSWMVMVDAYNVVDDVVFDAGDDGGIGTGRVPKFSNLGSPDDDHGRSNVHNW